MLSEALTNQYPSCFPTGYIDEAYTMIAFRAVGSYFCSL